MKKFFILFAIMIALFVANENIKAANIVRYDASAFIKVIGKIDDSKLNLSQEAKAVKRLDFATNESAMKTVFASSSKNLEISSFPISTNDYGTLKLEIANPIFDKTSEFVVNSKKGERRVNAPEFVSYYGKIEGQENSDVFISYTENGLIGYIQNEMGDQFNISKLNDNNTGDNSIHAIALSKPFASLQNQNFNVCATNDFTVGTFNEEKFTKKNNSQATTLYEVQFAIEGDNSFFTIFLNKTGKDTTKAIEQANAYMVACMAISSRLYERQINVTHKIVKSYLQLDLETDPYLELILNHGTLDEYLAAAPKVWTSRNATVNRDLVSHFTNIYNQPANSVLAGIANKGPDASSVLSSNDKGYAILGMQGNTSFPTLNYFQDIMVTAHEQGHNFGSPHTHNCYFSQPEKGLGAIDTCVTKNPFSGFPTGVDDACVTESKYLKPLNNGTIMSYCHLTGKTVLFFHPRNILINRSNVEKAAAANTISVPKSAIVKLTTVWGNDKFSNGQKVNIAWDVAKVNTINLKFSTNGGESWEDIIKGRSAVNDSIYVWTIPTVNSTNCLVRIESASDNNIFDQSVLPFTITSRAIVLTNPKENETIGSKSDVDIKWEFYTVSKAKIEYSLNGTDWIVITPSTSSNSFSYNFKGITAKNVTLRMTDLDVNTVFSETTFNLTPETIKFIYPSKGQVFCQGKAIGVTWSNEYARKFILHYSTDMGATWLRINNNVTPIYGDSLSYAWTKANTLSAKTNYKLKATDTKDTTIIIAFSDEFDIAPCTADIEEESFESKTFKISTIQPNPASSKVKLTINNTSNENTEVEIYIASITGAVIKSFGKFKFNSGEGELDIDVKDVAAGNYFVVAKGYKIQATHLIKIVK